MTNRIRILILDDHALFRESLVRMLDEQSDLQVVGQCATVAEAQRLVTHTRVDVVLLDYDLGEVSGTDFLRSAACDAKRTRVLMVTAGMTSLAKLNSATAGASGIVLKHSSCSILVEAIRMVASGGTWWDAGPLEPSVPGASPEARSAENFRSLTDRQHRVLRHILDGLSNKEIASKMQVSESAIKACIQELFIKAGVRSRSQLVRIALETHAAVWLRDR